MTRRLVFLLLPLLRGVTLAVTEYAPRSKTGLAINDGEVAEPLGLALDILVRIYASS